MSVVERRATIRGYELYLVEQWACSRQSPTLFVVTYTGDQRHSVAVGVLSVPADENSWSPKVRVYFKTAHQYHARPKDTALGELMVTNLSSFPSALTVISIPGGDIKPCRQAFIVNEDLKRLGCSGRSGLTLTEPTEATQTKFQQLYKTSDRIPFSQSVSELVKMCQVALYMFEKLDPEYIDGLLCDITERAVGNWWTEVGAEHYNYEPSDGILGPSTVAALLGMLMGARNRLQWCGAPVPKDVFDIGSMKRGVAYFQRTQKLEKTRRIDRQTLFRLHNITAKAAAGEVWGVQKAVKSTMTEIGGKRGEMVMGMVSGKDKGGIADIETLDIGQFVSLVHGERAKWLWRGKPRRTPAEPVHRDQDADDAPTASDDYLVQSARRVHSSPAEDDQEVRRTESMAVQPLLASGSITSIQDTTGERDASRKTMLKSVAGKVSDARGRIKDAVGGTRRTHANRPSTSTKEDIGEIQSMELGFSPSAGDSTAAASPGSERGLSGNNFQDDYLAALKRDDAGMIRQIRDGPTGESSRGEMSAYEKDQAKDIVSLKSRYLSTGRGGLEGRQPVVSRTSSIIQSAVEEEDASQGNLMNGNDEPCLEQVGLNRRHSVEIAELVSKTRPCEDRWPRRMSFGDAEEAILGGGYVIGDGEETGDSDGVAALPEAMYQVNERIAAIMDLIEPWVEEKLKAVEAIEKGFGRDQDDLQQLYYELMEAYRQLRSNSDELLAEERTRLTEGVKDVEVLAQRLDYEINSLVQRATDVEDGMAAFERQVEEVEKRADELKAQLETESWVHWLVRSLTGVGTGPNITQSTTHGALG